jgi:hypothetical protein
MRPRSLFVRLTLALVALVAGALAAVYLVVVPSLERNLVDAKQRELRRALPRITLPRSPFQWQNAAQRAAGTTNARVGIY